MSCAGKTGKDLERCKAKANYEKLKKRHPNMTKSDTLLVNKSLRKSSKLENFTNKKIDAAVALKLKEKKLKSLKGKKAEVNLIGTANAKSRKTTVKVTPRKKALLKKNRTKRKEEYVSTAVFNKKELASKVTLSEKKKKTQEELAAEVKAKETQKSNAEKKKKTETKKPYVRGTGKSKLTKKTNVSVAQRRKTALANKKKKDNAATAASLAAKKAAVRKKLQRTTKEKLKDTGKKVKKIFKKKTPAQKKAKLEKKVNKKLSRKMTGPRWNAKWN
jgi:hypothetical protein